MPTPFRWITTEQMRQKYPTPYISTDPDVCRAFEQDSRVFIEPGSIKAVQFASYEMYCRYPTKMRTISSLPHQLHLPFPQ